MKRSKKKKKQQQSKHPRAVCLNCGELGPHFVPPSLGDKGFFICESKVKEKTE